MASQKLETPPALTPPATPTPETTNTLSAFRFEAPTQPALLAFRQEERFRQFSSERLENTFRVQCHSLSKVLDSDPAITSSLTPDTRISIDIMEGQAPSLTVESPLKGDEKEKEKFLSDLTKKIFPEGKIPPEIETIGKLAGLLRSIARNGKNDGHLSGIKEQLKFETKGTFSEIGVGLGWDNGSPSFSVFFHRR